jgi:hypothetical protein
MLPGDDAQPRQENPLDAIGIERVINSQSVLSGLGVGPKWADTDPGAL